MKRQVKLTFCHHVDIEREYSLVWDVKESLAGAYWFQGLKALISKKIPLEVRFNGFLGGPVDLDFLGTSLNECIDIINRDGRYHIDEKFEGHFDQVLSNRIHHHFEVLSGPTWRLTEYSSSSSTEVRWAVHGLNKCIHDMEAITRAEEAYKADPEGVAASLHVEFMYKKRYPIMDEIYSEFSLDTGFGDMVLHYPQIGKTWLEVFLDEDEDVGEEGVQPLCYITGEFDVLFYDMTFPEKTKERFRQFLKEQGVDPKDPRLALGHVSVAKLQRDPSKSNSQYQKEIANHHGLKRIELLRDGEVKRSQTFEIPPLEFRSRRIKEGPYK